MPFYPIQIRASLRPCFPVAPCARTLKLFTICPEAIERLFLEGHKVECEVGEQKEGDEEWVTRSDYHVQVAHICGDLPAECVGFFVLLRSAVTQRACAS